MPPIKKSYGVICFRKHQDKPLEIIMIKKSTTYHFCEFVAGHYHKYDDTRIIKLFNNMTYYEKMDILSLEFPVMWSRIYKINPKKFIEEHGTADWVSSYLGKLHKFKSTFIDAGTARLKKLIAHSCNVETPWEFPKGRKDIDKKESDMETALREFTEESGLKSDKYKILWHVKPYIETYTDLEVTYQNIYYFVKAVGKWEPELRFYDKQQIGEVSAIKWISKNDLLHIKLEETTYKRLLTCFEKISRSVCNNL